MEIKLSVACFKIRNFVEWQKLKASIVEKELTTVPQILEPRLLDWLLMIVAMYVPRRVPPLMIVGSSSLVRGRWSSSAVVLHAKGSQGWTVSTRVSTHSSRTRLWSPTSATATTTVLDSSSSKMCATLSLSREAWFSNWHYGAWSRWDTRWVVEGWRREGEGVGEGCVW